jgi:hypothetical protein
LHNQSLFTVDCIAGVAVRNISLSGANIYEAYNLRLRGENYLFGIIKNMKATHANSSMPNNHITRIVLGTVLILLIPLVAMQFTSEVKWNLTDFIVMGILIFGTGLILDLVTRKARDTRQRITLGILILAIFFYIWAELALGIFTTLGS